MRLPPRRTHALASVVLGLAAFLVGCSKRPASTANVAPPTRDRPWTNSLGMQFVPVEGTGVLFSVFETRHPEFQLFLEETGTEWIPPDAEQGPEYPAANVTWDDAVAFCDWLTQRERLARILVPPSRYRLPTDAEWTLAAGLRGDEGVVYSWGASWPPPANTGNYWGEDSKVDYRDRRSFIGGYKDGFPRLAPVGRFPANRFGLHDASGNLLEWCEDWYDASHRGRIARGGSWMNGDARSLSLLHRAEMAPRAGLNVMGFRCVVVP